MGGTRFFGIGTVERLLSDGHDVTVATRGLSPDSFGERVKRIVFDHRDEGSIRKAFSGKRYDAVIDKIAFSSNDVRRVLDNIDCGRYILMSTCGVYNGRYHTGIGESEFDPYSYKLEWGERDANGGCFGYDEGKRQAECALARLKPREDAVMVRYPVVMGRNDYTGRLKFYIDHTLSGTPMYINDPALNISYISEDEAAAFFADSLKTDISGPVNACSDGTITLGEIIGYIEQKTGTRAVVSPDGDPAPYNSFDTDTSYDTEKAKRYGISLFSHEDWIFELTDYYIGKVKGE
jgi:nucleoside-diphosphate-sugar epimerase